MFADIIKDKKFKIFFSFLVGLFIATLIRPTANYGKNLSLFKTPPMADLRTSVYRVGKKCFRFHATEKSCPDTGVIEPFEWGSA